MIIQTVNTRLSISMTLQDDDTLDHLLEEYYRREYLDHRLFTLQ